MHLTLGQLLNYRYEILSIIGGGGMGDVYKAFDHNLHKEVAVKVIRPGTFSDDMPPPTPHSFKKAVVRPLLIPPIFWQ